MKDIFDFLLANPTAVVTLTRWERGAGEPMVMVYFERDGDGWRTPVLPENCGREWGDLTKAMDRANERAKADGMEMAVKCPACEFRKGPETDPLLMLES